MTSRAPARTHPTVPAKMNKTLFTLVLLRTACCYVAGEAVARRGAPRRRARGGRMGSNPLAKRSRRCPTGARASTARRSRSRACARACSWSTTARRAASCRRTSTRPSSKAVDRRRAAPLVPPGRPRVVHRVGRRARLRRGVSTRRARARARPRSDARRLCSALREPARAAAARSRERRVLRRAARRGRRVHAPRRARARRDDGPRRHLPPRRDGAAGRAVRPRAQLP